LLGIHSLYRELIVSKVAIITGGAQGIGLGTATRFLQEGATVVIVDINPEPIKKAIEHLKQYAKDHCTPL